MRVSPSADIDGVSLASRYQATRAFTEQLAAPLSAEDCLVQSMPDVSPTRWHLAHTTWFFETFVLKEDPAYQVFDASYEFLFNSYYNSLGTPFPRSQRGLISRPGLDEIHRYRRHVDQRVLQHLHSNARQDARLARIVELGLQHEQQHQELLLTDIKHVLSCNPLQPIYRPGTFAVGDAVDRPARRELGEGIEWIGHDGTGFCFDNEMPRHRVFLEAFQISDELVTCGDFLQFIADDGYRRPELWLSLGWQTAAEQQWQAPLYWHREGDQWSQFTLAGPRQVDPSLPVCHVSYFEADAFARWAGARLPTEAEWEVASRDSPPGVGFADTILAAEQAIHPGSMAAHRPSPRSMFGDVWQWTASPYTPYPGYVAPDGALGEYNGKFMCNQYVLRGGSCGSSSSHLRPTYRNFFPPEARWQFSGIRLCR